MSFLTPVWNYVDALVHPTAQQDALTAARHRAFIAPRLLGSFAALASFPVYIALRGVPSALEVGVFAWLVAPILIVFLPVAHRPLRNARTSSRRCRSPVLAGRGAVHRRHRLVRRDLAGGRAARSGAVGFAPGRSCWRRSSRSTAAGSVARARRCRPVAAAMAPAEHGALAALGIISAALYATGLALGAEQLARTSFWLLHAEEDRYRLLARNMTDVIMRHGRNGAVLFVSPAAEALFGVPLNELLRPRPVRPRPCRRSAGLSHRAGRRRHAQRRALARIPHPPRARCPACRPIHLGGNALPAARSRPASEAARREVVAVLRDISERKAQEHAIEDARAESERANAAKSRFLATMSHELRTPLNAIIGFSEMLTNETLELDAARKLEYARLINESGRHLLSVVNGILDMSKMETGNFEITPRAVRAGAGDRKLLRPAGAQGARGRRRDQGSPRRTTCRKSSADRRAFSQILINLISNAIKFTPRGGRVTVERAARRRQTSLSRSRTPASASAKTICRGWARPFSRRAHPMTAATTAPASACRSSKAWCGCTAARSISAAGSARARA